MKKRTKKLISMSLASIMALSLAGCGGSSGGSDSSKKDGSGDAGKTLNIWCWNDEFQSRFNDYYPEVEKVSKDKSTTTLKDGTVVKWTINPNENNNYQNKLDEALLNQEKASADDKIDIFLIEADYALKYVDSDYTMDIKDLGLTDDDLSEQYQYTKDIVTVDGTQKGTTWQATPGLFAYRRSIAKDVLGTDDPEQVQAAVADWDKFNAVAEKANEKGYPKHHASGILFLIFDFKSDFYFKILIKILNIIKYSHDFIKKIFSYVLWQLIYPSNDNSSRRFRLPGTDIITPHIPECIQIFSIKVGKMKCISNPPMYFRNIFTACKIQNNLSFFHFIPLTRLLFSAPIAFHVFQFTLFIR